MSAVLLTGSLLHGQSLLRSQNGSARIIGTDQAVLEMKEPRKDLPCTVTPVKPYLGFDLKFHAGYEVTVPLKELAGGEDLLTMIFRVAPADSPDDATYLFQRINVPALPEDAKGEAYFQGGFDLGEGNYKIDWLMRDRSERVCSFYWDAQAELAQRDKGLDLTMPALAVAASDREPFKEEPPLDRPASNDGDKPLNVKVMVNFAPQNARSATLQPIDLNALVSILRSVARDPRIHRYSIVAFNMQEQRVLYRQDASEHIDFPALGDALQSLKLGTVDVRKLAIKNSETQFLSELITKEMASDDHPDALIFAGPKVLLNQGVSTDSLREVGEIEYPVFYMNYTFNPALTPWRDAIGNAVKYFKGQEYTISRPRDLWHAWTDIMTRVVKFRLGRRGSEIGATQ